MKSNLNQIFKEVMKKYKIINDTYNLLEKTYEMELDIHPAGQWILDNRYIIKQVYKDILDDSDYIRNLRLPTIKTHNGNKLISIYYIAMELIEKNNGYTDQNFIYNCLREHQKTTYLTSEELNIFPMMLKNCNNKIYF